MFVHPPFFIVCLARSGSTLLRLILTAHPKIVIPPESRFAIDLQTSFPNGVQSKSDVTKFAGALYTLDKFRNWQLSRSDLETMLNEQVPLDYSSLVTSVYELYRDVNFPEATCWGDKNPTYLMDVPQIDALFPNARYIYLVRDPRSTLLSTNKMDRTLHGQIRDYPIHNIIRRWKQARTLRSHPELAERWLTVRYEDLVLNSESTVQRICSFLQLSYHESMLKAFFKINAERNLVPQPLQKIHQNTFHPISSDSLEKWRTELDKSSIEALEIKLAKDMAAHGYSMQTNGIRLSGHMLIIRERLQMAIAIAAQALSQYLPLQGKQQNTSVNTRR